MKIKISRKFIMNLVNKNLTKSRERSKDEVSIINKDELDFDYIPDKVTDYIKNYYTNKVLTFCTEVYPVESLFDIDFIRTDLNYSCIGYILLDKIFKYRPARLSGTALIKTEDDTIDPNLLTLEEVVYEADEYYTNLESRDESGGITEYIFQFDKDNNIVLPNFEYIELDTDKDANIEFIDNKITRNILLGNLNKGEVILDENTIY